MRRVDMRQQRPFAVDPVYTIWASVACRHSGALQDFGPFLNSLVFEYSSVASLYRHSSESTWRLSALRRRPGRLHPRPADVHKLGCPCLAHDNIRLDRLRQPSVPSHFLYRLSPTLSTSRALLSTYRTPSSTSRAPLSAYRADYSWYIPSARQRPPHNTGVHRSRSAPMGLLICRYPNLASPSLRPHH